MMKVRQVYHIHLDQFIFSFFIGVIEVLVRIRGPDFISLKDKGATGVFIDDLCSIDAFEERRLLGTSCHVLGKFHDLFFNHDGH